MGKLIAQMPPTSDADEIALYGPYVSPDGYITLYRGTRLAEYALMMAGKYRYIGWWWSNTCEYAAKYAALQENKSPGLSCVLFVEIPAKYIKVAISGGSAGEQCIFSPAQALPHARRMGMCKNQ